MHCMLCIAGLLKHVCIHQNRQNCIGSATLFGHAADAVPNQASWHEPTTQPLLKRLVRGGNLHERISVKAHNIGHTAEAVPPTLAKSFPLLDQNDAAHSERTTVSSFGLNRCLRTVKLHWPYCKSSATYIGHTVSSFG